MKTKNKLEFLKDENPDYFVITMDCDFTHSPEQIKFFLNEKNKADLIIGSRFIENGGLKNWLLENIRLLCVNCYYSFNANFPSAKKFCK